MGDVAMKEGPGFHDCFFPRRPSSCWGTTSAFPLLDLAKIRPLGLEELPHLQVGALGKGFGKFLPQGLLQLGVAPLFIPFVVEAGVLPHEFRYLED